MASTYLRPDSPYIWISYKTSADKWRRISSGFRRDNPGDRKQAQRLAQRKTLEEMQSAPDERSYGGWAWGSSWIDVQWGDNPHGRTIKLYKKYFSRWLVYFEELGLAGPNTIHREHVLDYLSWRKRHGGGRNTAIYEIGFLAMLMDEARKRGYRSGDNPARGLMLQKERAVEKVVWSDHEIALVDATIEDLLKYEWLQVTFLMGRWQAVRLRQSAVPLSAIDFQRRVIVYPDSIVKGGHGYAQPIDPQFYERLLEIANHRASIGAATLCDIPELAGVAWRELLDDLELPHLSHHGLRATWITRAALRGIPEALTRRFVNHASQQVHEIYQKITATDLIPMLNTLALAAL
jgi:integrase